MSKKKNKNVTIFVVLLLAATILYFVNSGPAAISGFNTLSLDEVRIDSDNSIFDSFNWVMTVRQGGLAQEVFGEFTPSEIDDAPGGEIPTSSLRIGIDYNFQECLYAIDPVVYDNNGEILDDSFPAIYDISKTEFFAFNDNGCALADESVCFNQGKDILFSYYTPLLSECNVVCGFKTGALGTYDNPDIDNDFTVTIEVADGTDLNGVADTYTKSFHTLTGVTSGYLGPVGNEIAYFTFGGFTNTGLACAVDEDDFIAYDSSGGYSNYNRVAYANYVSKLLDVDQIDSDAGYTAWLNAINQRKTVFLQGTDFTDDGIIGHIDNVRGVAVLDVSDNPVGLSQHTAYIRADWLGIDQPVGDPEIVGFRIPNPVGNDATNMEFDIKNFGSGGENFQVFGLEPCEGYNTADFTVGNTEVYVGPGQTSTAFVSITGTGSQSDVGTCGVRVEGIGGFDQQYFDVFYEPQASVCTSGSVTCAQSTSLGSCAVGDVCVCENNAWVTQTDCNYGCFVDNGDYQCNDSPPDSGGDNFLDIIKDFFSNLLDKIKDFFTGINQFRNILAISIGLLSWLLIYGLVDDYRKGKEKAISVIFGLLAGGLIAYLIYSLFWIGVISSIVVGIVFVILKVRKK